MVLRKGSVSAKKGEKLLIPINMRDGSLICIGKGNPEWNCSAPHGAGRLMSRRAAFSTLSMEQYRKEMKGIYSTCVVPDTLDESPMAYKAWRKSSRRSNPRRKSQSVSNLFITLRRQNDENTCLFDFPCKDRLPVRKRCPDVLTGCPNCRGVI